MAKTKRLVVEKGYYEILEVSPSSTTVEIQRSFERLCEENVDLNTEDNDQRKKSAEILFTLTKAYEILTDPFQRISYDERKFGSKLPINNEVETIFREGLRYFRANNIDTAIRFFKEASYLFPHRSLYRVHLAIAYSEKGLNDLAEKELRMALSLDPENEFAQEATAKILFKVSDKKIKGFFSQKINRQLTGVIAVALVLTGSIVLGTPYIKKYFNKMFSEELTEAQIIARAEKIKSDLPKDMLEAMQKQSNKAFVTNNDYTPMSSNNSVNKAPAIQNIQKIDNSANISPTNKEYVQNIPSKRTFYKDQSLIVVEYENGKMLSYSPQNLVGWKQDSNTNLPVLITKNNQFIPVSKEVPITLPDGKVLNPNDKNFPKEYFPEYELGNSTSTNTPVENTKPNINVSENKNNSLPPLPNQINKPPVLPPIRR